MTICGKCEHPLYGPNIDAVCEACDTPTTGQLQRVPDPPPHLCWVAPNHEARIVIRWDQENDCPELVVELSKGFDALGVRNWTPAATAGRWVSHLVRYVASQEADDALPKAYRAWL